MLLSMLLSIAFSAAVVAIIWMSSNDGASTTSSSSYHLHLQQQYEILLTDIDVDKESVINQRDLWQNPLWATPATDVYWSAKEQPHHNDNDWSGKHQQQQQQQQTQTQTSSSNSDNKDNSRPLGNPFGEPSLVGDTTTTQYADPDNLCEGGVTGYRATIDCTSYVYCNDGALMGGGASVIQCDGGQLFDNTIQACTSILKVCPATSSLEIRDVSKPLPPPPIPPRYHNNIPPPTRQPISISDSNNIVATAPTPPTPPALISESGSQAASSIVSSITNTNDNNSVDNEGEEWNVQHSPTTTTATTNVDSSSTTKENRCSSNEDCRSTSNLLFCNQPDPQTTGTCGQCLVFNGMGCSTDQVCRTSYCHVNSISSAQDYGSTKCYTYDALNSNCQSQLNDEGAVCDVYMMICVGGSSGDSQQQLEKQQQEQTQTQTITEAAVVESTSTAEVSNEAQDESILATIIESTNELTVATETQICTLCDQNDAITTNQSKEVTLLNGHTTTCSEFDESLIAQNIFVESAVCEIYRHQFMDQCCTTTISEDVSTSVPGLTEDKSNAKCNLCVGKGSMLNPVGITSYLGNEFTCSELENMFVQKKGMALDDCGVVQRSYSDTCCTSKEYNHSSGDSSISKPSIPPRPSPTTYSSLTGSSPPTLPTTPDYLKNWHSIRVSAGCCSRRSSCIWYGLLLAYQLY